jgi:hypothetical protein
MVQSHVERNGGDLHVSYYDAIRHKEGCMDLHPMNPSDLGKIHDEDRVEVVNVNTQPVTLHISHPDGTTDDIRCTYS